MAGSPPEDGELLLVGQVGRAHGIRGEVAVVPRTDDPQERFAEGEQLRTDRSGLSLSVAASRFANGRLLVEFDGIEDRNAAEALRGTQLLTLATERPALEDPDDFYDTDLIGLRALTVAGAPLGDVVDVLHAPGGDLLAVRDGERELLIPFVRQIVPVVDIAAGTVSVDPPDGLLDL
jgi:16S rRNA processing protein RimM